MLAFLSSFLLEIIAGTILIPLASFYGSKLLAYLKSKRFEKRMNAVYRVYDELQSLRDYLDSERVLLMRTTNGGGLPAPGNTLYATIIAEVDSPGNKYKHLRAEWQNRLIDHEYIRMLEKVYTDGCVRNNIEEMPEHSMLRGAYEKLEIKGTRVIKVGIFNNAFYYVSIAYDPSHDFSPAEEYTIETAISNLKKLLK